MSLSPDSGNAIDPIVRTTQIISIALIAGVTFFLLIVVYLVHFAGFGAGSAANPAAGPGQAAARNGPEAANAANRAPGQQPTQSIPILTYLSVAVALALLPLSFILPNILATQNRQRAAGPASGASSNPPTKANALANPATAFQTSAIIGGALNEGPAFLAGIAYLIEQNVIALGVLLVALAGLIVRFPTRERIERWIAIHEEKLRSQSSG